MSETEVEAKPPQPSVEETHTIRRRLDVDEVSWKAVLDAYQRRTNDQFFSADEEVIRFFKRLVSPFNVHWFGQPELKDKEAHVGQALLEVASADVLTLVQERVFTIWPTRMQYRLEVQLRNKPESDLIGTQAQIEVSILGLNLRLNNAWSVLLVHAAASCVAAIFLFFALILLLYGFFSFMRLLSDPLVTIRQATKEAPLGISLLCFLVGMAGLCGRGISHLIHLLLALVRNIRNW